MSLEEQLDIAMKQRATLAACVVGTLKSPCVSEDSIRMKNATMGVVMSIFEDCGTFRDSIEKELLLASRNHCIEQMEIMDLLDGIS